MKKLIIIKTLVIISIIFSSFAYASAAVDTSMQSNSSKILLKLGVIESSKTSSNTLKLKIKKYEYISLVVNALGYESDSVKDLTLPYKDVDKSHKAYNNIKIAYKFGIISGKENSSLAPNSYISYSEALTMILNGLGYSDLIKGLSTEDMKKKASELGICKDISLASSKLLTNGEAFVIICNSLSVDFR